MLDRIWNHIVAFVAILILIVSAPLVTLAAAVWMASINRIDPNEITLSVMVGPVLCAFWYMFVASVTRAARAKREGVNPRTGFLWAGGRLFGGWFFSFASTILTVFFGISQFVRYFSIKSPSYILFPALFFTVWAPVIINLLRHFMRYLPHRTPIISPTAGVVAARTVKLEGGV